jgi:hypothetical protein
MGKLDAGQCNGRTAEGVEASHRGASAFDRSMILLNKIAEVLAASHLDELPLRILPPQIPKGAQSWHTQSELVTFVVHRPTRPLWSGRDALLAFISNGRAILMRQYTRNQRVQSSILVASG